MLETLAPYVARLDAVPASGASGLCLTAILVLELDECRPGCASHFSDRHVDLFRGRSSDKLVVFEHEGVLGHGGYSSIGDAGEAPSSRSQRASISSRLESFSSHRGGIPEAP